VRAVGSDIRAGEAVLRRGDRLGAAEVGLLACVGATQLQVRSQPPTTPGQADVGFWHAGHALALLRVRPGVGVRLSPQCPVTHGLVLHRQACTVCVRVRMTSLAGAAAGGQAAVRGRPVHRRRAG